MQNLFIGIDTSCYTSSVSCVNVNGILSDERILLSVANGERGLRQSDAVFQHTKNLERLVPNLLNGISVDAGAVAAIGVSNCPSGRENSYMPVFLSGKTVAASIAAALHIPLYCFTHQQGHIRAALCGNETLIGKEFIAFHLSGGTTDMLRVSETFAIECVGGSTDINAGQFVDRVGVKLGMRFPAGKALEELAAVAHISNEFMLPSYVRGLYCSFSGVETKANRFIDNNAPKELIAIAVYDCIARTLSKLIKNAMTEFKIERFLLAGGVASSAILRKMLLERLNGTSACLFFSHPKLASDNAVGTALLAMDQASNLWQL